MEQGSVSQLLQRLQLGEESAAARLWSRYHARLTRFARAKLNGKTSAVADEDDIVITAFTSFLQRVQAGGYPQLFDRAALWRLLVQITMNKARNHQRDYSIAKRGGDCRIVSLDDDRGCPRQTLHELACREPRPEVVASMRESLEHLFDALDDDELREIAIAKLRGFSNPEIALQRNRSLPTIERRVRLIRLRWRKELAE